MLLQLLLFHRMVKTKPEKCVLDFRFFSLSWKKKASDVHSHYYAAKAFGNCCVIIFFGIISPIREKAIICFEDCLEFSILAGNWELSLFNSRVYTDNKIYFDWKPIANMEFFMYGWIKFTIIMLVEELKQDVGNSMDRNSVY